MSLCYSSVTILNIIFFKIKETLYNTKIGMAIIIAHQTCKPKGQSYSPSKLARPKAELHCVWWWFSVNTFTRIITSSDKTEYLYYLKHFGLFTYFVVALQKLQLFLIFVCLFGCLLGSAPLLCVVPSRKSLFIEGGLRLYRSNRRSSLSIERAV